MAKAAGGVHTGRKTGVRIVVAGERGTGKSSLIVTVAAETFPTSVPPVLPPTRLPEDYYQDHSPITIIDTSSRAEDVGKVAEELKLADAVVLTYACDNPATLNRLSSFWLPELRRLESKVPVIIVGCKLDLRDESQQVSLEQVMSPIMQQFREIETCIECSASKQIQIPEVFYYAQKAVLHPTGPLFDQESQTLKPRCVRALKRIFMLCDNDRDDALNDAELNDFQVKCFNAPLQPTEVAGVKRVVEEKLPGGGSTDRGVNERGLTLTGFLFLHALFIEKGRLETTWAVLRKFNYDNDIKLAEEFIPFFKMAPDQSAELTKETKEYLYNIYDLFDSDHDNNLRPAELDDLFSTAPESPWEEAPYKDAVERTSVGGMQYNAFFSEWTLMTLLDPSRAVENLIYLGYPGDPSSAIHLTRKRSVDRKKHQSERNVYQCFVFGSKRSGKSSLLNSFIGRSFSDNPPSTDAHYAVNSVDLGGVKKTLVLREIPDDQVNELLSEKASLAPCDVSVFLYDSSDEISWKRTIQMLTQVATHGENNGFQMPCLVVAAKDDLASSPTLAHEAALIAQELGIEAPISLSTKMGDNNNVFRRIVKAAENPHLGIPETEAGKSRKQYQRLINRSLMVVSVGAAVAFVGIAAYRVYAARKNTAN